MVKKTGYRSILLICYLYIPIKQIQNNISKLEALAYYSECKNYILFNLLAKMGRLHLVLD